MFQKDGNFQDKPELIRNQLDGNDTGSICSDLSSSLVQTSNTSSADSIYASEEELDPRVSPVKLDAKKSSKFKQANALPLVMVTNARSLYPKPDNLKTLLTELGIEIAIVSETWERERESLETLLKLQNYKIISYKRQKRKANKKPGGGAGIIYNENRFEISKLEVPVPSGVEAAWSLVKPKEESKIKKIAVCSLYVSPTSKFKTKTIDHLVETIHLLRSQHDNEISFLLAGDLNQLNINKILECYGCLKQIVTEGTRKSAILENIITDLQGLYHPPTCLPPLEVDDGKAGKDSDHNVILLAPINQPHQGPPRKKKTIRTRPLPESQIKIFGKFMTEHKWEEVFETLDVDSKVENFHNTILEKLNTFFPVKTTTISSLDKKWMSPELKQMQRRIQREFFKRRKNKKWKKMKKKFKILRRKTIQKLYKNFVEDLKQTDPPKWYGMAKRIGAGKNMEHGDLIVD